MLEDVFTCKQEAKKCVTLIVWHSFQKSEDGLSMLFFYDFERVEIFAKITHLKILIFFWKIFYRKSVPSKTFTVPFHFSIEWTLGEISSERLYLWREGKYSPQTTTWLSAKAYVLLMLIKVKMYLMRRCFKYKETYFCHTSRPLF